jgi:hypothetical protein
MRWKQPHLDTPCVRPSLNLPELYFLNLRARRAQAKQCFANAQVSKAATAIPASSSPSVSGDRLPSDSLFIKFIDFNLWGL